MPSSYQIHILLQLHCKTLSLLACKQNIKVKTETREHMLVLENNDKSYPQVHLRGEALKKGLFLSMH